MTESTALKISQRVYLPLEEVQLSAVRAQGAGGQNVNKVSSAIHLRFAIDRSSLPDSYKQRLRQLPDRRINGDGVVVIKAQRFRSQEKNRLDALERLRLLIVSATQVQRERKPTRPTRGSQRRRVDDKTRRGQLKSTRKRPEV
jgi:ribosome-associated protein